MIMLSLLFVFAICCLVLWASSSWGLADWLFVGVVEAVLTLARIFIY